MLSTLILAIPMAAQTPPVDRPAPTTPYVKFEQQIQAKPGEFFVVKPETNLVYRKWTVPPGLTIVPAEHTKYGDGGFVCFGPAGEYTFCLEGTLNDQFADGTVTVLVRAEGPKPPAPRPPAPVPPDNPLTAELQRLYDADSTADKAAKRAKLLELWDQASVQLAGNPKFTAVRQFRETLHAQSGEWPFELKPTDLRSIREKIAAELSAALGADTSGLGPPGSEVRTKGKAVFDRYCAALAAVK
jgi:hypothetical protein